MRLPDLRRIPALASAEVAGPVYGWRILSSPVEGATVRLAPGDDAAGLTVPALYGHRCPEPLPYLRITAPPSGEIWVELLHDAREVFSPSPGQIVPTSGGLLAVSGSVNVVTVEDPVATQQREPELLSSWTQTFNTPGSIQAWEGTAPSWARRLRLQGIVTAFGGTLPGLRMDAGYYDAAAGRRWNQAMANYCRAGTGVSAAADAAYVAEIADEGDGVAQVSNNNFVRIVHALPLARGADKNWLGFYLSGSGSPTVTLALRLWALP